MVLKLIFLLEHLNLALLPLEKRYEVMKKTSLIHTKLVDIL